MNFYCWVVDLGRGAGNGNSDGENFRVVNGDMVDSLCLEVLRLWGIARSVCLKKQHCLLLFRTAGSNRKWIHNSRKVMKSYSYFCLLWWGNNFGERVTVFPNVCREWLIPEQQSSWTMRSIQKCFWICWGLIQQQIFLPVLVMLSSEESVGE